MSADCSFGNRRYLGPTSLNYGRGGDNATGGNASLVLNELRYIASFTNTYECTKDQELAGVALWALGRRCVHSPFTRRQHFSVWIDAMAAILKLWRNIVIPTPLIDVYFPEDQSCQTSYRSGFGLFEEVTPTIKKNKMISDIRSVTKGVI